MTEVMFHFNAPDKDAHALRLVRKACANSLRALVLTHADGVERLSQRLWSAIPTEFMPHCVAHSTPSVRLHSSIGIATDWVSWMDPVEVVVNLSDQPLTEWNRFARLVEVVSLDPHDRALARQRWRLYAAAGLVLKQHDLASSSAAA